MSAGDIHNHNGSICKATKKPCPFGDEGHSKDVDSFVAYHEEHSGVDGDQVRKFIADGAPLEDAVEIAKLDSKSITSTKRSVPAKGKSDLANEAAFAQLKNELETGRVTVSSWKDVRKISHEQWGELVKAQEGELTKVEEEAAAFTVESGYDPNYVGAGDYKAFYTGGLDKVREELQREYDRLEPNKKNYENWLKWYNLNAERLARLEKAAKPGEEKAYFDKEAARAKAYEEFDRKVSGARFRLKYLKMGAELTDPNRKADDGTPIPLGYSVQRAVYNEDGELLGVPGNSAFPRRYTDSKGRIFVTKASEHSDPAEADRRNKARGLFFGEMLTESKIDLAYGIKIAPENQTKAVRSKNIPLTSNRD